MFGRIPRLPVDVMFKQVLHDPVVVAYSSYVTTLVSHLHDFQGVTVLYNRMVVLLFAGWRYTET